MVEMYGRNKLKNSKVLYKYLQTGRVDCYAKNVFSTQSLKLYQNLHE